MNLVAHGLASYALTRVAFPRAPRLAVAGVILAGTAADVDELSAFLGAPAYLRAHHTFTHSLAGIVLTAIIVAGSYRLFGKRFEKNLMAPAAIFAAAFSAAALHLAMDICGWDGVALLWPFNDKRLCADWVASLDPWILAILLAGALVPVLFGLIKDEIGARAKTPRGRVGAALALSAILVYTGGRMILHGNAVDTLEARTYRKELPRRVAAFPEAATPFVWNGLVETESALHEVLVRVGPVALFDPESSVTLFKPAPSAILDAAQNCGAAQRFLRTARFPKATIEKTGDGYRFELRDLLYAALGKTQAAPAVAVELGAEGQIREQEIVWERDLTGR